MKIDNSLIDDLRVERQIYINKGLINQEIKNCIEQIKIVNKFGKRELIYTFPSVLNIDSHMKIIIKELKLKNLKIKKVSINKLFVQW